MRADTYLLDTWTGRVWQIVVDKAGSPLWQEMNKENLEIKRDTGEAISFD